MHELAIALDRLRDQLRGVAAQLSVCRELAAKLPDESGPQGHRCPECGIGRPTEELLRDHLELVHDIVGAASGTEGRWLS
jgi:hypothetical protein